MTCTRCRGCMVMDQFMDMRDDTGQLEFQGGVASIVEICSTELY